MLPQDFTKRMKDMLGEEFEVFQNSYNHEKYQAFRINGLKGNADMFRQYYGNICKLSGQKEDHLTAVPWCGSGWYYPADVRMGKHPYHEAGVYYIQEPSAMAPAEYLAAEPGERVLDLCTAPGGKSTQIAAAMQGRGILICNEIHPARAKILSENIERMGVRNAIVTNESPANLSRIFINYFDKIMVDAPCSGEGMFRKNPEAQEEWSQENVRLCAERQVEILEAAAGMLKPGGRMVYSTCTFSPEENEGSISRFLHKHVEFYIEEVTLYDGMETGNPEWCQQPAEHIERTIRLWPHRVRGEGHFLAVLRKRGSGPQERSGSRYGEEKGISLKECRECMEFCEAYLKELPEGIPVRFGDTINLLPAGAPSLHKLKVLRAGLQLGTVMKKRFEPSHSLALALKPEEAVYSVNLPAEDRRIFDYINGQTFELQGEKGWHLVCVDGYSLGFGKLAGGIMKNHYPKGLRKMLR